MHDYSHDHGSAGHSANARDQEVTFSSAHDNAGLAGSVCLPDGDGPHPAVLLVHGQGPFDRDMSFAHLNPFRTLAHHLAGCGIASLRYDKRGTGQSEGRFDEATLEVLARDATAAFDFFSTRDSVNSDRTGMLGISEGGVIVAMVAGKVHPSFAVLLVTPALPGRQCLSRSFTLFSQASPDNPYTKEEFTDRLNKLLNLSLKEMRTAEEKAEMLRLAGQTVPHIVNDRTRVVFGGADISPERFVGFLTSTCLQDTLTAEPASYQSTLGCPVLALYAEKDKHIFAPDHAPALEETLRSAGNSDFTVETVSDCNHLLQVCETGYPDEYLSLNHDIAPHVIDRVGTWILERTCS
jgi:pimeloyl-ACP methyl ester carboxylesterase